MGDIRDEFDEDEEELIIELGGRSYLIEASMKTDDINDALDTDLQSEDYDSIGGLMIEALERLPEDGEVVELKDGTLLQAKGIHQNRILKVLMTLPEPEPETDENDSQSTDSDSDDTDDECPAVEIGADVEM